MKFRRANREDLNSIMEIIKQAQLYFKKQGINQWQDHYPNRETIEKDLNNQNGYVLLKDDQVIGTVVLGFDGEKTYEVIYNGQWLSNSEYAVIHRMAVEEKYKGLGVSSTMLQEIEQICLSKGVHSIKVDTHIENMPMQKLLHKNGFQYCGIIYLESKSERLAFEKILDKEDT